MIRGTPTAPSSVYESSMTRDQLAYVRAREVELMENITNLLTLHKNEQDFRITAIEDQLKDLAAMFQRYLTGTEDNKKLVITRDAILKFMQSEGIN